MAVVGKYIQNGDAYLSVAESLQSCRNCTITTAGSIVDWIDSEELEVQPGLDIPARLRLKADAIVVCGWIRFARRRGQGTRRCGWRAKTLTPYLGICATAFKWPSSSTRETSAVSNRRELDRGRPQAPPIPSSP